MKLLILANCQAVALSKICEKITTADGAPLFQVLTVKPVYEMTKEERPRLEGLLQECDILLYQPHFKHKFTPEWRTSDYWVANTTAQYKVSFQSLFFSAYNPELTYVRNKHGQHLNEGFVDYHDKRILKLFLQDKPETEIADFFSSIQPVEIDITQVLADSLKEMKTREVEQNLVIKVSGFIEKNFTKQRLFYTYNHPANAVLYEVVRQLLVIVGHESSILVPIKNELLRFDYFPISPAVEKFLGLEFSDNQDEYLIQGEEYNKQSLVKRYLEIYSKKREWINASALNLEAEPWLNRKKLIFHIGQSKSGTTSFQSQAFNNSEKLINSGLLYPKTAIKFTNHALLTMHYQGVKRDNGLISRLKTEIDNAGAEVVLISCESFEGLRPEQIEELFKDFREYDLSVICVLRERLSWAASMYIEYVKKAWFTKSFNNFIFGLRSDESLYHKIISMIKLSRKEYNIARHFNRLLSDKNNLSPWIDRLSKNNFILLQAEELDLWQTIQERFGLQLSGEIFANKKNLNKSPTIMASVIAGKFYADNHIDSLKYAAAMMFLRRIDKELTARGLDVSATIPFTSEKSVSSFLENYIADDIWLQKQFGFYRVSFNHAADAKFLDEELAREYYMLLTDEMGKWFLEVKQKFNL